LLALLATPATRAADPAFQNFFFNACVNPTGTLAARCGETPGGTGDLSGNSETSLNPNQTLSSNKTPLANARSKIREAYDHIDDLKDDKDGVDENALMIGPFSLLINGNRSWIDRDPGDEERGYDGDVYGVDLGLDYRLSDSAVIGGFLSYENTDYDYDKDASGVNFSPQNNSGKTESDTYSLTLFGSVDVTEQIFLDGSIGASTTDHTFERNVVFQESTRTIPQTNVRTKGKPDGNEYWISLSSGYSFYNGPLTYTPYVKASFARSEIDGYTEKDQNGSGLNMKIDDDNRNSLTTDLGIRASYAVNMDWGVLVPQAHFEYEHEFDEDAQESRTSYVLDANRTTYSLKGDSPDRNYFNAGAGVVAIFPHGWMAFLDYVGLFGYKDLERHQLTAGIRKEF
jgi:uncharacterized protein with beta-barrel porin domain